MVKQGDKWSFVTDLDFLISGKSKLCVPATALQSWLGLFPVLQEVNQWTPILFAF